MTNSSFDVIVIGAGHNGLTAAAFLAKKGRRVLVVERRAAAGGLAASEEFHKGAKTRGLLLDTHGVREDVVRALDLEKHGLSLEAQAPPVYVAQEGGPGLVLHRDAADAAPEIAKHSKKDAERYVQFRDFIERVAPFVRTILDSQPPGVVPDMAGIMKLLQTGLSLRRLGSKDMLEVMRIGPMCIADWLNEWFESDILKVGLAAPALTGTYMGPWSAGTTATFLLEECAVGRGVEGGPNALIQALTKAAQAAGAEIRLSAGVRRIVIKDGRASGVVIEDGLEVSAPVVVSSADPKRTFLDLVSPTELPLALYNQVRVIRTRGICAKVNLALNRPLEFSGRPGQTFGAARVVGKKLDDLEKAFDAVKYRKFSDHPLLEIRQHTTAGIHVAELLVHFAPFDLAGGWTKEAANALADRAIETLARVAPSDKTVIAARQVLTPADLESQYGLTGGHVYHGEHGLDQLYALRPSVDLARYATPVAGLFLAGSGNHPGGGITCAPGLLGAKEVLRSS
ncbi:MAG: NAD(P)/FAD-dependent oxidoreductase [Proteobacteria bacterium]|nr:NAD(P)/FAD-dependent oxidoreductase [Pseudomonadota bacterium]